MGFWSDQEKDALREHVKQGLSGGESAKQLSEQFGRPFTRSMATAEAGRLDCHFHKLVPVRQAKKPRVRAKKPKLPAVLTPNRPAFRSTQAACTIWGLARGRCHYPLWDDSLRADPNYFYCGAATEDDNPYCPYHMVVVYRTEHGVFNRRRVGMISAGMMR